MKFRRREFLQLAAGAAVLPVTSRLALAETYPSRPVRVLVGFTPGGPTDIAARLIAQWLSDRLGQPFIVDNRPGAATNIATEAVAHAPPDGYTLLAAVSSNAINPALYTDLTFSFTRDIAMVAELQTTPMVLEVNPSVPVSTVPELIAYAKANPNKVTLASFGTGTIAHVGGELFKMNAGIQMVHVPYRGSAPMVSDLLAGQVQVAFDNLPSSIEFIRQGKLRALAVTTSKRWPALPDVPALSEFQPGFEANVWVGIAAPRGTPAEIIERVNRAVGTVLADARLIARFAELGGVPMPMRPEEFGALLTSEVAKWAKVVKLAGLKPE